MNDCITVHMLIGYEYNTYSYDGTIERVLGVFSSHEEALANMPKKGDSYECFTIEDIELDKLI